MIYQFLEQILLPLVTKYDTKISQSFIYLKFSSFETTSLTIFGNKFN